MQHSSHHPLIGIPCVLEAPSQQPTSAVVEIKHAYVAAVVGAGGVPVLIPPGLEEGALRAIYACLDGLLLAGGGDVAPNAPALVAHSISIRPEAKLATILGTVTCGVNSRHHQAVKDLASGLVVAARAPDGIVEGVESPEHGFVVGVQWRPENMVADDQRMQRLFGAFVVAAR